MNTQPESAVQRWTKRLREAGIEVPETLTNEVLLRLYKETSANPKLQHLVAHFALHVHSAQQCGEIEQQTQQQ